LTGDARNVDHVENVSAIWVDKSELTRFIPEDQIYRPVFNALGLTDDSVGA
jgi:hypothetical protein